MSRLHLLVLSDRYFFITCRVLRCRGTLEESEFQCLARVLRERREKYQFLLTAGGAYVPPYGMYAAL